jgi:L-rhamnose-H+ transport protein
MPNHPLSLGLLEIFVAGAMVGTCMLPLKSIRVWRWENTWLCFSFVSLLLVPIGFAVLTVPSLSDVYRSASPRSMGLTFVFGTGWGIAQVLFGISVVQLGMALAFAIIVGLGALIGTVVPLAVQNPNIFSSSRGVFVLLGTFLMLAGIAACCYAGRRRDRAHPSIGTGTNGSRFGLALAVISGLTAGMLNLSLAFGRGLVTAAEQHGAAPMFSSYAVWPIALAGGFVPNAAYSLLLLRRNHSWNLFARSGSDLILSALMGILWIGAVLIYTSAAYFVGVLGTSAGWALYQICMILVANASGILAGEWRGCDSISRGTLAFGLLFLIVATAVIAIAAA